MEINKNNIKNIITQNKDQIKKLGVTQIGLFGSFVKGEQNETSDIDLIVAFDPDMERFDNLMRLYDFLENKFKKRKIDIVTMNGLSPFVGPSILAEAETININD